MATHFSILAWRTPWTEETGGLQSVGQQRVGVTERLTLYEKVLLPGTAFLSERHICTASQTFASQSFALPIC